MVVTPDGTVAWRRADWQETLELDLSLADVKQFTPNTDLWAQRRVECFRLSAAAPASSQCIATHESAGQLVSDQERLGKAEIRNSKPKTKQQPQGSKSKSRISKSEGNPKH